VGFAGAANASATVDLVWIDVSVTATNGSVICLRPAKRNCPQLGTELTSVAVTDNITLAVILTAGPNGSIGGGVSVNYGDALSLSVVQFQSLSTTSPAAYLPHHVGTTTNQPPFIDNINAAATPLLGRGIGLPPGQSAYLGTVTFHQDTFVNGTFEIAVGTDGPGGTDGLLDGVGNSITATTTFNSAYLYNIEIGPPTPTATPTAAPTPTPEPGGLTALGSGVAMLALLYRRHRHSVER
jgi:hypothetical protein